MPGGLATGQLLDERYALEEPLGEDALGTTWRAHDRGLGRTVHLREMHYPDDLFAREPAKLKQALMAARLAIRLDHVGAVHVYDAFVDADRLMVVSEAVTARSLAALVERKGPLPPKRAAAIGLDLLDPLVAAHAKGLVHGSLTPEAVLVPDRGAAQLTGLGMAPTFLDGDSRAWMDAMAVAACLAPEQVELRGATPASDLWALGATLYFAVEAAHAFDEVGAVVDSPPRPATKAQALGSILERLLSKEPAWRPDLGVVRLELAAVAGVVLDAAAQPVPDASRRRGRRDRRRPGDEVGEAVEAVEAGPGAAEVEPAETDTEAEPDWDAAVLDPAERHAAATPDDTAWSDWSAGGSTATSDVWLPGIDLEDDGPPPPPPPLPAPPPENHWARAADADADTDAGEARMAAPDLTEDLDARVDSHEDADPFTVVPFKLYNADQAVVDPVSAEAPAATDEPVPAAPGTVETGMSGTSGMSGTNEGVTAATDEGDAEIEESRRFRSMPSWPPPTRRRSFGVIALCSLVMIVMVALLITNGRLGRPKDTASDEPGSRPVLATDAALVPRDWIAYRHPNVDFTVSYPPRWTIREEGSLIVVRDPATGTELRVDYRKPRGPDPEQTWMTQERDFSAKHPNDYKRLQLSPASYLGHVAALWEYTYLEANLPVHAVDLGFLTDDYGFTLSFRAPAGAWDTMLPMFHGFLSSVRAPD